MEDEFDPQEEAYLRSMQQDFSDNGSRSAYNDIDLQNKLIEPTSTLSGKLAISNFQLGNISESEYSGNIHDVNFAIDCIDMPFEQGGFFLNEIGLKIMKKLDIAHIMSGSKSAKKWDSLTQDKKVNVLRKEQDTKKGTSVFQRNK